MHSIINIITVVFCLFTLVGFCYGLNKFMEPMKRSREEQLKSNHLIRFK
jgi:hypothetical protein